MKSGSLTVSAAGDAGRGEDSTPVASLMSTNVPSLSSEVVGAVLATVSLTCSPVGVEREVGRERRAGDRQADVPVPVTPHASRGGVELGGQVGR